ncbi:MAG: glycosyltransferase family 39 protein [Vicinamibacterales bacterium]
MTTVAIAATTGSIALIFLAGTQAFPRGRSGGFVAAGWLALTPLLWRQALQAPASVIPIPFVVGWLLAIARGESSGSWWWPGLAGACLGLGVYTSYASLVMMPTFLVLTIIVSIPTHAWPWRSMAVMVAVFAVAAGPIATFLFRHPDLFRHTVNAFHLYDANRFNLRQGLHEMVSWVGLTARSEVYYDYFNPAFLFLTGRVLLFPMAVLIPAGLLQIVASEETLLARLSLAGFLAAPLAASLTAQAPIPARILFITPFAALVSTYGLKRLLAWWSGTTSFAAESTPLARSRRL